MKYAIGERFLIYSKKGFDWIYSLEKEKEYWITDKKRIISQEWQEHVRQRTDWFMDWYRKYENINDKSKILHLGSGADGEINFINKGERIGIDPLADFYKLEFSDIMNKDVKYLKGRGENLPFKNNSFDLVISFNSLDHFQDPTEALREISRILKKGGILYLGIHVKSKYGHLLFEIIKKIRKLTDHYHSYTKDLINSEVGIFLQIIDERGETLLEKFAPSRRIKDIKNKIKNLLFFTVLGQREFVYHLLARKGMY